MQALPHRGMGTVRSASSDREGATLPRSPRGLADLALFQGCSSSELALIDSLSTWVRVRPGRVLCQEGAVGREYFVIVDGSVTVQVPDQPPHRLGEGQGFGEMAMLDHTRRVGTVTADEPTQLIVFSVPEFDALLVQVPHVAEALVRMAGARRRMLDNHEPDPPSAS
jgi:CRP-like cAMP-binding protein